jgi:hypothetical protein
MFYAPVLTTASAGLYRIITAATLTAPALWRPMLQHRQVALLSGTFATRSELWKVTGSTNDRQKKKGLNRLSRCGCGARAGTILVESARPEAVLYPFNPADIVRTPAPNARGPRVPAAGRSWFSAIPQGTNETTGESP